MTASLKAEIDVTEAHCAMQELMRLGDGGRVHDYLADQFAAFARDPSQGMEVAFEAGHWVLRPSPDFLAALASLRAIRGLKVSAS